MFGSYPQSNKHSSIVASYYFRQYEIKRTYARNFYRGLGIALGIHAIIIVLLILYQPIYQKPPESFHKLLPPVDVHFTVMHLTILSGELSGMDFAGKGGGNGTVNQNPGAAFANVVPGGVNSRNTITPRASVVPRALQGPGMNDIIGINKSQAFFDTLSGYSGTSKSGKGSGGGTGSTIGNSFGYGAGLTDTSGFGGGFGNKFVPGNPANNSATGTPFAISWNGVPRTLVRGSRPQFPPGVQNGGTVRIRIIVDPRGDIVAMVPVEKSNSRLEEAAMSAIRTWEFSRLPLKYPQVNQQAVAKFVFRAD